MHGIIVKPSPLGGVGVFATQSFTPDDLIELCPILALERRLWGLSTSLDDHLVCIERTHTPVGLPLGYGALYNHADVPNASWEVDSDLLRMEVRASATIAPGDEILIHYGNRFFEARRVPKNSYEV
jgi:uncharacterized protein